MDNLDDSFKKPSKHTIDSEGYLFIPPNVKDHFGKKFAKNLYDKKKINKPIDTVDVYKFEIF